MGVDRGALWGHLFNMICSTALIALRRCRGGEGIFLLVRLCDARPFWWSGARVDGSDGASSDEIVECVFVDDECLVVSADPPPKLDESVDTPLPCLSCILAHVVPI